MSEECAFKFRYGEECEKETKGLQKNKGPGRIQSIIDASRKYGDNLHIKLQEQLTENPDMTISYHKNCVSRYTSKSNLGKHRQQSTSEEPQRKLRKSSLQFNFRQHCLYCGEICDIRKDYRHPDRWRPAYLCRSTKSEKDKRPYKEFLLERCAVRNDEWGNEVRIRLEGALDLHAADARYHRDCMCSFMAMRNIQSTGRQQETDVTDPGLDAVFQFMLENKNSHWNTVELYDVYSSFSTIQQSRKTVIEKVKQHFADDVIILSSPGYASIVVFRNSASFVLKMVKDDKAHDDLEHSKIQVARAIEQECKDMICNRMHYDLHIDKDKMNETVSPTLSSLLSLISPKMNKTLAAAMVGNIVTSLQVWMVSPIKGRSVTDINATVAKNDDIMEDLLAMHGISGCDTVAPYYGIGKGVPLRVLRSKKHPLSALGDLKITLRKVIKECIGFILACYGEGNADSASDARYKLWMKKVSKNIARSPKLKSLPPTDEALAQNVARAHIQVAVWRNSLEANPPELDPLLHGWYNVDNGILAAVMLPPNTELAPKSLLKSIKCECKGEKPCNTRRCSCNSSVMTCGTFCNCQRVGDCWNYHTRISDTLLGNHSDEDDDDSD